MAREISVVSYARGKYQGVKQFSSEDNKTWRETGHEVIAQDALGTFLRAQLHAKKPVIVDNTIGDCEKLHENMRDIRAARVETQVSLKDEKLARQLAFVTRTEADIPEGYCGSSHRSYELNSPYGFNLRGTIDEVITSGRNKIQDYSVFIDRRDSLLNALACKPEEFDQYLNFMDMLCRINTANANDESPEGLIKWLQEQDKSQEAFLRVNSAEYLDSLFREGPVESESRGWGCRADLDLESTFDEKFAKSGNWNIVQLRKALMHAQGIPFSYGDLHNPIAKKLEERIAKLLKSR